MQILSYAGRGSEATGRVSTKTVRTTRAKSGEAGLHPTRPIRGWSGRDRILWFLLLLVSWQFGSAEPRRPNFIVIMCDDLGYGDIGGFGSGAPSADTPRIQQLASEGAKLTNFLVPVPYCAPSRASFLTGRYPFRTGLVHNPTPDQDINDYGLDPAEITVAEVLRDTGYATACIGKWHLGHKPGWLPTDQGFDDYLGILYSNDMRPVQLVENTKVVEYPVIQGHLASHYTRASIEFIRSSTEADRPFFLFLAHAMPHKPLAASEAFYTPETPNDLYADVLRELDWSVGEILDALHTQGISKDTLVVFTSDNGPWYGGSTGGLRGMKAQNWEGGIRVPFIARWPGRIPAGLVNPSLASSMDLFATFLKLAGTEQASDLPVDGRNLWPLLTSETAPSQHEFLLSMHRERLMTVHSGPWKLHVHAPPPYRPPRNLETWIDRRGPDGLTIIAPGEQSNPGHYPGAINGDPPRDLMLFNTASDPGETTDVSGEHPAVVERLHAFARGVAAEFPELPAPKGSATVKRIPGGRLDFWNAPGP